ncbi:hypothetical protein J6590_035844 [Homalodisca vitripennis]|nr:hypothetical protein J6590_035844 [Homalodisca vitripennis]
MYLNSRWGEGRGTISPDDVVKEANPAVLLLSSTVEKFLLYCLQSYEWKLPRVILSDVSFPNNRSCLQHAPQARWFASSNMSSCRVCHSQ